MKNDYQMGFSTIPNKVKYDSSIKFLSRMILSDILSYNHNGLCFASNKYFAEIYGVSVRSVENALKELREKGYILSDYRPSINKRVMIPNMELMGDYKALFGASDEELEEHTKKEYKRYDSTLVKEYKKNIGME